MLKGVPALIPPDLLHTMALMGHGDRLAVADRNYPATSLHGRVHALTGADTVGAARALTALLPLDTFVEPAAFRMVPDGDPEYRSPAHDDFEAELARADGRRIRAAALERSAFYELARGAFAVVHTADPRPFACFLLTKGVMLGESWPRRARAADESPADGRTDLASADGATGRAGGHP